MKTIEKINDDITKINDDITKINADIFKTKVLINTYYYQMPTEKINSLIDKRYQNKCKIRELMKKRERIEKVKLRVEKLIIIDEKSKKT